MTTALKDKYSEVATGSAINSAAQALTQNGMEATVVETLADAKAAVLTMIPQGAEVFTMTSVTLDEAGIAKAINESGAYDSVRNKLNTMDRATQGHKMQQLGAAPDYAVGSVHAVTEDGVVMIASNGGSQLSAYAHAAAHVIWVVGAQKIVKDLDAGFDRVYSHSLPLEKVRAKAAYGIDSQVSKLLIVNREVAPNRVHIILVNQVAGF